MSFAPVCRVASDWRRIVTHHTPITEVRDAPARRTHSSRRVATRAPGRNRATPDRASWCEWRCRCTTNGGRPSRPGGGRHGATATPLQRREEFADRPFITDAEAAQWVATMLESGSKDKRDKNSDADLVGKATSSGGNDPSRWPRSMAE